MIELYWAYANYETMMDLTQQIIVEAIEATGKATNSSGAISTSISHTPFQRRTYRSFRRAYRAQAKR